MFNLGACLKNMVLPQYHVQKPDNTVVTIFILAQYSMYMVLQDIFLRKPWNEKLLVEYICSKHMVSQYLVK